MQKTVLGAPREAHIDVSPEAARPPFEIPLAKRGPVLKNTHEFARGIARAGSLTFGPVL